jgi:hypothetical protein
LDSLKRIIELFTQKTVVKLSKNIGLGSGTWDPTVYPGSHIWDPISRMQKKPIPDPGSGAKKAPDPRSATRLIYNNKNPDLIKQELGGKVVLLGE